MEKNIGFSARVFRYFKIKLIGKVAFVLYVREFAWDCDFATSRTQFCRRGLAPLSFSILQLPPNSLPVLGLLLCAFLVGLALRVNACRRCIVGSAKSPNNVEHK